MVSTNGVALGKNPNSCSREFISAPNGGKKLDKIVHYGWKMIDERGACEWIDKGRLNVDYEYQRTKISKTRIAAIVSEWSWVACGCLVVGMRSDESLWVIDGQHRKLAADKRSDIVELPCMIFEGEPLGEAKGFLQANLNRRPLTYLDKINAMVVAGDAVAIAVKRVVEDTGYRLAAGGMPHTTGAVGCLYGMWTRNAAVAEKVWRLCVQIHSGAFIKQYILMGLFELEMRLIANACGTSIFDRHNVETLSASGVAYLNEKITSAAQFHGNKAAKVCAIGITSVLNHRRTTRRIPESIF